MPRFVFQSGDDYGENLSCYNCGTPYAESVKDDTKKGDGVVCCECGGRIAYVVDIIDDNNYIKNRYIN